MLFCKKGTSDPSVATKGNKLLNTFSSTDWLIDWWIPLKPPNNNQKGGGEKFGRGNTRKQADV